MRTVSGRFESQIANGATYDYSDGELSGPYGLREVADSLSWTIRYNGQTRKPWSVAAHARLTAEILVAVYPEVHPGDMLEALHHDDEESLVGDVVSPMKAAIDHDAQERAGVLGNIARRAQTAILAALGIDGFVSDTPESRLLVRAADLAALEAERRVLFDDRMVWPWCESNVDQRMLHAGQLILLSDDRLDDAAYGENAAEWFIRVHDAIMQRLVSA